MVRLLLTCSGVLSKRLKYPFFIILMCSLVNDTDAQTKSNFIRILDTDSENDIIKKAVNVVPSARQLRWQQLEMTAFIHFGINTFTGREWGDGKESPSLFNPSGLDARQWVKTCKEAGFKLVILTAKHHDGFCLWPSRFTEHSVKSSPWKDGKGDVVKETADACREYGIEFGIYLSPWDRNSSTFGSEAYNDFFVNQLTELLTNYGRIGEVWFDGANGEGAEGKKQRYDFKRWYSLIRKLQPEAVIAVMGPDIRWVGTEKGYGRDNEWSVVPGDALMPDKIASESQKDVSFAPVDMTDKDLGSREKIVKAKSLVWYPAEMDVSIRPGWFYHASEDDQVKSPKKLLDIYYGSVGRNGTLLLNLPPDKRGLIHENDVRSLQYFKKELDRRFKHNILKDALSSPGTRKLTDNDIKTNVVLKGDKGQVLEFDFGKDCAFNTLVLQEDISRGQRVEELIVECMENGRWKTIAKIGTVGYKRIIEFERISSNKLRLTFAKTRGTIFIGEAGLYNT